MLDILSSPETLNAVLVIAAAILTPLMTLATNALRTRTGIKISAERAAFVQGAVLTGLRMALTKGMTKEAAIELAVEWAAGSGAGDTVRLIGASKDDLRSLAMARLQEVFP